MSKPNWKRIARYLALSLQKCIDQAKVNGYPQIREAGRAVQVWRKAVKDDRNATN